MNTTNTQPHPAQPSTVRTLRRLVAECRSAGIEHLTVDEIEAAIDKADRL